jgi:hypothetical protein
MKEREVRKTVVADGSQPDVSEPAASFALRPHDAGEIATTCGRESDHQLPLAQPAIHRLNIP